MAGFQGVAEKFYVSLVAEDGYDSERVVCQIGLDGLVLSASDGGHIYHKYPLNHISRWAIRSSNLVLYTKTPSDVEEKTLTLHGTESVVRSMLDTLTSSCMQMAELLQSRESTAENRQASTSLNQLLHGNSRRGFQMPSADDVDYWNTPEKCGWLHSQGDHIKTWRRRWFVLKQGYLFRFAGPDVSITSKPRGIVDLSKVNDVSDAREQTGKNNSLKLSTIQGVVSYIADSETELVEWMSALEGAVQKIVKAVAGVHDEEPAPPPRRQNDWSKELEKGFSAVSGSGSSRNPPSRSRESSRPTSGFSEDRRDLSSHDSRGYERINIHDIAGIAGMARSHGPPPRPARQASSNTFDDAFVKVEYPSYPVLAPGTPASHAPAQGQPRYDPYAGPSSHQQAPEGLYQAQQQYQGGHHQPQQQQQQQGQYQQPEAAYGAYGQPAGQGQAYHGFEPASESLLQQAQPQPQAYAPQQAPSNPAPDASWQVHYTGEGRAYYHHAPSGTTQWDAPVGFAS